MFMTPKIYGPIDHVEVSLEYKETGTKFMVIALIDLPGLVGLHEKMKAGVLAAQTAFEACAGIALPIRVKNHIEEAQRIYWEMFKLSMYRAVEELIREEWGGMGQADGDDLVELEICLKEKSYECYLSADGYMDRTDSQLFDTIEEVHVYFDETYNILKCPTHGWQEFDEDGCHGCQDDGEEVFVEKGLKTMDEMEVATTPGMTTEDLI